MGRGRKTLFNDSLTAKIIKLYESGKTDAQVAYIVGISERTINNWKGSHPDFLHAIRESKCVADDLVEAAMFSRATGYSHTEEKLFCYEGHVVRAKTIKQYAPDVTAGIFWLCNRQPERWRRNTAMPEAPQPPQQTSKLSYVDFCKNADYPAPFEKQIEMFAFAMHEEEPRLLLGSRGYGKTDYAVILGIAYDLYVDPSGSKNLIITKSKERNAAMLREIQQACEKNGVQFEKANSTCLRVAGLLGKDHSVSAVTIKTVTLRGRHPKRVIMDDPVTEDDASEATRAHVERVYNEVSKLCSNVLIIGQPAHKFDLYAKLRPLLLKMEVPHGTIPELDADLDAQKKAGVSEASISASYHLKILSEGTTPFDNVKYIDKFPSGDSAVAFIDPSHEGMDFTALTILKAYMQGVVSVGFIWKKSWNHCLDDMAPLLNQFGVKKMAFETNALGDMPIEILLQAFPKIGIVGRRTMTNKHSRIMAAGTYAHMIHLSRESHPGYINQVVQYEYNSKNDDAPDSLASCLEWIGLIRGKQ